MTNNAHYYVKVKVNGKWLNDDKSRTFCGGNCYFRVSCTLESYCQRKKLSLFNTFFFKIFCFVYIWFTDFN